MEPTYFKDVFPFSCTFTSILKFPYLSFIFGAFNANGNLLISRKVDIFLNLFHEKSYKCITSPDNRLSDKDSTGTKQPSNTELTRRKKHVESKRVTDDEFPDHHHHQPRRGITTNSPPPTHHHQLTTTKITIPFIISSFMTIVVQYHRIVCFFCPPPTKHRIHHWAAAVTEGT